MSKNYYEVECWFKDDNFEGGEIFNNYIEAKKCFNEMIKENNEKIKHLKENLKEYGEKFTKNCIDNWALIDFIQINNFHDYSEKYENYQVDVVYTYTFDFGEDLLKLI